MQDLIAMIDAEKASVLEERERISRRLDDITNQLERLDRAAEALGEIPSVPTPSPEKVERVSLDSVIEGLKELYESNSNRKSSLGVKNLAAMTAYTESAIRRAVELLVADGFLKDDTPDKARNKRYSRLVKAEEFTAEPEDTQEVREALDHARMDDNGSPAIDLPLDPAEGEPITLPDLDEKEETPHVFRLED